MKLIISELNDALLEAGASPEKAKAASESVADFQKEINEVKSDLKVIKWGVGLIFVVVVIPYLKVLVI